MTGLGVRMGVDSTLGVVPVKCCTSERKSLGSVLYTCGAGRGCVTDRRKLLLLIFNEDLLTESEDDVVLARCASVSDMSIGAAMPPA